MTASKNMYYQLNIAVNDKLGHFVCISDNNRPLEELSMKKKYIYNKMPKEWQQSQTLQNNKHKTIFICISAIPVYLVIANGYA